MGMQLVSRTQRVNILNRILGKKIYNINYGWFLYFRLQSFVFVHKSMLFGIKLELLYFLENKSITFRKLPPHDIVTNISLPTSIELSINIPYSYYIFSSLSCLLNCFICHVTFWLVPGWSVYKI